MGSACCQVQHSAPVRRATRRRPCSPRRQRDRASGRCRCPCVTGLTNTTRRTGELDVNPETDVQLNSRRGRQAHIDAQSQHPQLVQGYERSHGSRDRDRDDEPDASRHLLLPLVIRRHDVLPKSDFSHHQSGGEVGAARTDRAGASSVSSSGSSWRLLQPFCNPQPRFLPMLDEKIQTDAKDARACVVHGQLTLLWQPRNRTNLARRRARCEPRPRRCKRGVQSLVAGRFVCIVFRVFAVCNPSATHVVVGRSRRQPRLYLSPSWAASSAGRAHHSRPCAGPGQTLDQVGGRA